MSSPGTRTDPELVDRLARLRAILPLLAGDLASARRRAHTLERENQRLSGRIAELESRLAGPAAVRPGHREDAGEEPGNAVAGVVS